MWIDYVWETVPKEAVPHIRIYLYGNRILELMFKLYFASKEKIISIQSMVLKGYVNADSADVYVFFVHKATC